MARVEKDREIVSGLVVAGKYELLYILGEGGMGSVWAATHLGLNQTVALKIISSLYADSPEARSRFDHEAKAAARLKSRYVVQVFDNGELPDGTPYMAMELLEGESLSARIGAGPLPVDEVAAYLDQIARAIDRAHEIGIIHRDIKPENVFLSRSHDDERGVTVKVLDFGIAKIAPMDGAHSQTKTGVLMGTPLFMSPEQARGLKSLDHRSDLYSIAMMAFTMVTGTHAFGGESLVDLVLQVCTYPLPSFADRGVTVPADVEAWFQRACSRDPEERFSTARELADTFAVAAGVRAGPSGDSLLSARFTRPPLTAPRPPRAQLPKVATSSLDGAAQTRIDPARVRSKRPFIAAGVAVLFLALGAVAVLVALRPRPAEDPPITAGALPVAAAPMVAGSASAAAPPTAAPMAGGHELDPSPTPTPSTSTAPAAGAGGPPAVKPATPARRRSASAGSGAGGVEVGF